MPDPRPMDPSAVLTLRQVKARQRVPSATKLGPTVGSCVPPKVDAQDMKTRLAGCQHRQVCAMPGVTASRKLKRRFRRFVFLFLKKFVREANKKDVPTFEEWVRKQKDCPDDLIRANSTQEKYPPHQLPQKFRDARCFGKDEHYPDWKCARGIAGRSLEIKCRYGRYMSALDSVLKDCKWLVKGLDPEKLKARIVSMFRGSDEFAENDFTSFEASLCEWIIKTCECQLFKHVLGGVMPGGLLDELEEDAAGQHVFRFKEFSVSIQGRRRSGDLWTSSGNAFTNLMLIAFCHFMMESKDLYGDDACSDDAAWRAVSSMRVLVEGDDSIVQHRRLIAYCGLFEWLSEMFGFKSKVARSEILANTSFLQRRTTPDCETVLRDWRKVLATFGWSKSIHCGMRPEKLKVLLRAKSYSLAYQFPKHPILYALARRCLHLTAGVALPMEWLQKQMDLYEYETLVLAIDKMGVGYGAKFDVEEPTMDIRAWYAVLYSTPIDVQLYVEGLLLSLRDPFATITDPVLQLYMPVCWSEAYSAMCAP